MSLFKNESESVEEFWKNTEAEIGEKVVAFTMGRCLSGCGESEEPKWGLYFVTSSTLYFRHFAQRNWLSALMVSGLGGGSKSEPREIYLSIPVSRIDSISVQRESSLLRRLFSYSPPVIFLSYRDEPGDQREMRFFVETKLETFVSVLSGGMTN